MAGRLQLEQGAGHIMRGRGSSWGWDKENLHQGGSSLSQHDIGHLEIWKSPFCIFRANVEILMILYPGGIVYRYHLTTNLERLENKASLKTEVDH